MGQFRIENLARTIAIIRGYNYDRLPETSWFFGWNESKAKMSKRAEKMLELIQKE